MIDGDINILAKVENGNNLFERRFLKFLNDREFHKL